MAEFTPIHFEIDQKRTSTDKARRNTGTMQTKGADLSTIQRYLDLEGLNQQDLFDIPPAYVPPQSIDIGESSKLAGRSGSSKVTSTSSDRRSGTQGATVLKKQSDRVSQAQSFLNSEIGKAMEGKSKNEIINTLVNTPNPMSGGVSPKQQYMILKGVDQAMGGSGEDLLPMFGQMIGAGLGTSVAPGPGTVAGGGIGAGVGEMGRQLVRNVRGKDTSNVAGNVAYETALGATGETAILAGIKGVKLLTKAPGFKQTANILAQVLEKTKDMGDKAKSGVYKLIEFMSDVKPGSIDYVMKNDPVRLLTKEIMDPNTIKRTAGEVVEGLENLRKGASQAFKDSLNEYYKSQGKIHLGNGADSVISKAKIHNKISRVFTWPIAKKFDEAMVKFGYKDVTGKLRNSIAGDFGSFADEANDLQLLMDRIKNFKPRGIEGRKTVGAVAPRKLQKGQAFIEDLLNLREEVNDMIYKGFKTPRTQTAIRESSSKAKEVLRAVRREISEILHRKVPGLKKMDDAFGEAMDIVREARPFYGDSIKAEKFMRKIGAFTRHGEENLTRGELNIMSRVDKVVPHIKKVMDHVYAREFVPVINNFWRSRAFGQFLAPMVGFGVGFQQGGIEGAAKGTAIGIAATSPAFIKKGMLASIKSKQAVETGAKVVSKVAKKTAGTVVAQKARSSKNEQQRFAGMIQRDPKSGKLKQWDGKKWVDVE